MLKPDCPHLTKAFQSWDKITGTFYLALHYNKSSNSLAGQNDILPLVTQAKGHSLLITDPTSARSSKCVAVDKNKLLLPWGAALQPHKMQLRRAGCLSLSLSQVLTCRSAASPRRTSASARSKTWTSQQNNKRTSNQGWCPAAQQYKFPKPQRLQEKISHRVKRVDVCNDPHQKQS